MVVFLLDTDEGITVLPIHLSGVKSDENLGRNCVYCPQSSRPPKYKCFPRKTFPGAYACWNLAESCRYGDKRGDCVLHSCFAPRKRLYMVDFMKNSCETVSRHVLYYLCCLYSSVDFFYANGRGGQGRANAMT
jgi:hypothetical protein